MTRDNHSCVICGNDANDAHHILDRKLWDNGGYYLNNGVAVCNECHLLCEKTEITVEEVREKAAIKIKVLPSEFDYDIVYDKWGNIIHNNRRLKGPLFFDSGFQKIMKTSHLINEFDDYVKYPRTFHLPWSEGVTRDDRMISNLDHLIGQDIVITEKMDGENTTLYHDGKIHARSLTTPIDDTRSWVKNFWSSKCNDLPIGWRICGENMFAEHSISYDNLKSYFLGFSIWNEKMQCLSWNETIEWFDLLGIVPVKVLYQGPYEEGIVKSFGVIAGNDCEGYVLRLSSSFNYHEFKHSVLKYVRKDHVGSNEHWRRSKIVVNKLTNPV